MAKPTNLYFIGRIGNVVGSTRFGKPYLRYQPDRIRQSARTIKSGEIMGMASTIGAGIRRGLAALLPPPVYKPIRDRFTGAIKKWLQTDPLTQALPVCQLPWIIGFNFNDQASLQQLFRVALQLQPTGPGPLVLRIPAFVPVQAISAPAHSKWVQLQIAIASQQLLPMAAIQEHHQLQLSIPYHDQLIPAQEFTVPYTLPAGSLSVVAIALVYSKGKTDSSHLVLRPEWLPCGIVAGCLA